MKANSILFILFVFIMCTLAILPKINCLVFAQTAPRSAIDVFNLRPVWKNLPSDFLNILANKLNSVQRATEFAQLCEKTGILKNNIIHLVDHANGDQNFAIGGVAATLTSYANAIGDQRQFNQAKHALEMALLLKPRFVPAWSSMALVAINMGDCNAAVFWADRVLTFKPDNNSEDFWEQGVVDSMTEEGEKRVSRALREPELIGMWKEVQDQMKSIKKACKK